MFLAERGRAFPNFRGFFLQISELFGIGDLANRTAMQIDYLVHRDDIVSCCWFAHATGPRVAISGERPRHLGHSRALFVGLARHDSGNRPTQGASFYAVVAVTIAHNERAEIGVTEPERTENV